MFYHINIFFLGAEVRVCERGRGVFPEEDKGLNGYDVVKYFHLLKIPYNLHS